MSNPTEARLKAERIRLLNDALRQDGEGGQIMITAGVRDRGPAFVLRAMAAIARFDAFDTGNDPYHEHDFGALTVDDERLFFKIDGVDAPSRSGIAMCQTGFVGSQFD